MASDHAASDQGGAPIAVHQVFSLPDEEAPGARKLFLRTGALKDVHTNVVMGFTWRGDFLAPWNIRERPAPWRPRWWRRLWAWRTR